MKIIIIFIAFLFTSSGFAQELEDYFEIAAANNAGLKAVYAEFEAALQKAPQVKSLPDPVLTVSAFGRMMETTMGKEKAKFSLMQMFPWFGTLEARENAASLMAEAKFQNYLDARNELFFQISRQYFLLYELEEKISFNNANFQILKNYKNLALSQVRSGSGTLTDVLKVELMMNESENNLEVLNMEKKSILTKFNALLNREKSETVSIPTDLESDFLNVEKWTDLNLESHPKLNQMDKMASAAEFQKEAARKNGMPTIGLGIDYIIMEKNSGMNMKNNGMDAIMPMFSISLPIFRKKYDAAMAEAEFMNESYLQQKIEVENNLESEFEEAFFQIEKFKNEIELYRKQIESIQRILDLTLSYYENATADFGEVLGLRQDLLSYQLKIAQAQTSYLTAIARMNYITGKSFENEN